MGFLSSLAVLLLTVDSTLGARWIGETKKINGVTYQCKCYSDNACWPQNTEWDIFNKTLGGALHLAIPPGAVCHKEFGNGNSSLNVFNAKACAEVQANWGNEQWL
jgi:hypothetical protein